MAHQLSAKSAKNNPFRLDDIKPGLSFLARLILPVIEIVSGLNQLARRYDDLEPSSSEIDFARKTLKKLGVSFNLTGEKLDKIPRTGPVLVVANHPFGGIEGIIMALILKAHRSDIKILANSILKRIPELSDAFIGVDPYNRSQSKQYNRQPMREAVQWLKQDGLLVVFPAGDVAKFSFLKRRINEGVWHTTISRLARIAETPIIPVLFKGRNSLLFHVTGLIHPIVRTIQLPRELLNKHHQKINICIGKQILPNQYATFDNDHHLAKYLRMCTLMLNDYGHPRQELPVSSESQFSEDILKAVEPELMEKEILALSAKHCLVDGSTSQVFYAHAREIPHSLREIARLREVTFRSVGEGTGEPMDLDDYDHYYLHLFIWNRQQKEIVGAYRLGLSDLILTNKGKKGFYTNSLFKYSTRFISTINPAIELGRSFIRPEYQRSFSPLMLLWKGIGQFIVQNPHYSCLFGPVSISNAYNPLSQQLLIEFLKANSFDWNLGRFVRARRSWKPKNKLRPVWRKAEIEGISSIVGISELVSVIEQDQKGMPILLKQYLKLGGRMLGFNVDHHFNDCLDGLVLVDLYQTEKKVLQRYMGKKGAASFLSQAPTKKASIPLHQ